MIPNYKGLEEISFSKFEADVKRVRGNKIISVEDENKQNHTNSHVQQWQVGSGRGHYSLLFFLGPEMQPPPRRGSWVTIEGRQRAA